MKVILFLVLSLLSILLLSCGKTYDVNGEVFVVTNGMTNVKLGLVNIYFLSNEQYATATDSTSSAYRGYISQLNQSDSTRIDSAKSTIPIHLSIATRYTKLVDGWMNLIRKYSNTMSQTQIEESQKTSRECVIGATHEKRLVDSLGQLSFKRFTVDPRAEEMCLLEFIKDHKDKNDLISAKSNSDGKFTVQLKNQTYHIYSLSSRQIPSSTEEYKWSFEYSPDGKPLMLSNDNLVDANERKN